MRQPHGYAKQLDSGVRVVVERQASFSPEEIWAAFTTPEGLNEWIGILRGSQDTGDLTFAMVDQGQEANPAKVLIHRCRAPHELSLTTQSEYGNWNLGIGVSSSDGISTIRFIHDLGDTDDPSSIGPGWEYYMERVLLALAREDTNQLAWDDFYPTLASHYTI